MAEELLQRLRSRRIGCLATEVHVLRHRGTGVAELIGNLPPAVATVVQRGRHGLAEAVRRYPLEQAIPTSVSKRDIEIRDGMLAVRPYADARLRNIALHEAKRTGHKDPGHVVEAAWLELARRAKLRGDSLCQDSAPTTAGGTDLDSETYMLTRIAKAWRTVRAIADRVEAHTAVESDGR